jgi:CRP-like cAMP-binding protein
MSLSPLENKLSCYASLTAEERALLARIFRDRGKVERKSNIISAGDNARFLHVILDGWAARYEVLDNGARQITAFLLPGDFCDIHVAVLGHMDHGIVALTDCRVAYADAAEVEHVTRSTPTLTRAFWWTTLVDVAILRQWIINNGRRTAVQAIAHLLCELHARMTMAGQVTEATFSLPLTQEELADATGMTVVHMNRVLQQLRSAGLIEKSQKTLTVVDVAALREAAGFDDAYLHLGIRSSIAKFA